MKHNAKRNITIGAIIIIIFICLAALTYYYMTRSTQEVNTESQKDNTETTEEIMSRATAKRQEAESAIKSGDNKRASQLLTEASKAYKAAGDINKSQEAEIEASDRQQLSRNQSQLKVTPAAEVEKSLAKTGGE